MLIFPVPEAVLRACCLFLPEDVVGCIWLGCAWAVSGLVLLVAWARRGRRTFTGFGEELLRLKLKRPGKGKAAGE